LRSEPASADAGQLTSFSNSGTQQGGGGSSVADGIGHIRLMDPSFDVTRFQDMAMDIFFKI
jgi:hypothetical protein